VVHITRRNLVNAQDLVTVWLAAAAAGDGATSMKQVPALDGIRGIAIIWVVLHNTMDRPLAPDGAALHWLAMFTHIGWLGVQLFFALSGLLITASLLDSQESARYFRNFYAKRALRILPLYYAVLFGLLVVLPRIATPPPPFSHDQQASLWLFTTNWTDAVPYGFGHFWSLAVEEQFYLFWPLVVWRLAPRRLLIVCLWIAVGALLLRSALVMQGVGWSELYGNTACRMDALALGGAGACALRVPELRSRLVHARYAASALLLGLFLVAGALTHLYDRTRWPCETFGYTVLACCAAGFVTLVALAANSRSTAATLLAWGPLRRCGRYSYAMYVFHGLLHKLIGEPWLNARFGETITIAVAFTYALVVLLVSYLLGYLSYHLLEEPLLRLKRFFEPGSPRSVRA
jgi:peptidoglycan/LPS O-acetylase OafA/YrhL